MILLHPVSGPVLRVRPLAKTDRSSTVGQVVCVPVCI